ncbi:hypothetical protein WJX81_002575 [Elliptochloris bilobata]|uniref:ACT domain-containing protein n=1 Tax=Elliptochloris bilobata TaxID=381761 RepID=A0AAW1RI40_9CHLO
MIDELRDLVPPQSHNSAVQDCTESKRPKHVVLSDTIALVRELQSKAVLGDAAPVSMGHSGSMRSGGSVHSEDAQDLLRRSLPAEPSAGGESPKPNSPPELPSAPQQAPVESGVVVEPGDGCLYVKVSCRDRRGLLSDLIIALKQMPLEITTAAITTRQDGNVYNVFQVKADDEHVSAADVQDHVQSILGGGAGAHLGDKRRRAAAARV